jgi:predicted transposase YdaD
LLAGLRFNKTLIQQLFRGESMRESVIYQDIFQQGEQQGEQKGELKLVLRLLNRRLGTIPADLQVQIQTLAIAQLENLGEALLDFSELADLVTWLQAHS